MPKSWLESQQIKPVPLSSSETLSAWTKTLTAWAKTPAVIWVIISSTGVIAISAISATWARMFEGLGIVIAIVIIAFLSDQWDKRHRKPFPKAHAELEHERLAVLRENALTVDQQIEAQARLREEIIGQPSDRRESRAQWFKKHGKYLQSSRWTRIRRHILHQAEHACNDCGAKATHVHHLKYPSGYRAEEYTAEMHDYLIPLCTDCHEKRHSRLLRPP